MSGPLVRRLRLPASGTSPAAARRAVAALLGAAGLNELRDESLLLTSELVTNGVVHAGTELELEMLADSDGVRITVTDFAAPDAGLVAAEVRAARAADSVRSLATPDLLADPAVDPAPAEGGRGLLLVSRFATQWGTSHERGGRAIWFRLDRGRTGPPAAGPVEASAGTSPAHAGPVQASTGTSPAPAQPLAATVEPVVATAAASLEEALTDVMGPGTPMTLPALLARLTAALGAGTATVSVDRGDGRGRQLLTRHEFGSTLDRSSSDVDGGRTLRVPLPVARPWTAELTATGARARHAASIAALSAAPLALLVENVRLTEAHEDRRGWLLFLAEAGDLLAQSMNVDLTVALIPRLVVPRLGRWCAVHLSNEYLELKRAAIAHVDEAATAALTEQLDQSLADRPGLTASLSAVPLGPPTHGLALPLRMRGTALGVLTVGRRDGQAHTADELAIIEDLGRRASVAIDNAGVHDQQIRITATLQRSLLPPALPPIEGLEVAAQYVPAGDGLDVGGDFYDLIPVPGGGWMLVVGDVSGKGVGAAAVTGLVRDVLHTLAMDHRAPEQTLARLNATLVERGGGYFCTLALAFLKPAGPRGVELSLHLAGHDQPVLLRAGGTTTLVGSGGTALGLLDSVRAPRTSVHLGPGDALVFYTDGVTERRRGRLLFGQRRLRSQLAAMAGSPATALAAGLRSAVLEFGTHPPRDDIAIVVLRPPLS